LIAYLSSLDEVSLEEALEIEVGNSILISNLQELGESTVGDDTTLVSGVKASVRLHVGRHLLGNLSLRALRSGRDGQERAQLRGEASGHLEDAHARRLARLALHRLATAALVGQLLDLGSLLL
jgi:hypothetical protein